MTVYQGLRASEPDRRRFYTKMVLEAEGTVSM